MNQIYETVRMLIPIKSRSSSKLGHVGSKTRSLSDILKNLVYTLEGTVLSQDSLSFVRMLIIILSRSNLKLCQAGSKTRSQGQIIENLMYTLKGTVFIQSS